MTTVQCEKLQKALPGLAHPPFPNAFGERIFAHISKEAWGLWLDHQTMLINEYRLNMLDPKARDFLLAECEKFLFEGGAEKPPGFVADS